MIKKNVYITRKIEGIDQLIPAYPDLAISYNEEQRNLTKDELQTKAKVHDSLITMLCDQIDADFIKLNKHLKVISNYAVGLNNIDLNAAKESNMAIGHTPGVLTHTTAETAIMLLLNVSRNFIRAKKSVLNGQWKTWEPMLHNGIDLRNKTLGVIGFGRIGQDFAAKAFALWGLKIITPKRKSNENLKLTFPFEAVEWEEFFNRCEVVSLHCPLTNETKDIVNESFIQKMKNPFILINTARGEVHNEADLLKALQSKKVLGIGLDVTSPEPMNTNSPLLNFDNVEVIPHIGSATDETRKAMTKMCLDNIQAGLRNEPLPYDAFC